MLAAIRSSFGAFRRPILNMSSRLLQPQEELMTTLVSMSVFTHSIPVTLIVRAILGDMNETIVRHIGINSAMTLEDFHHVLCTCFGFHTELDDQSPWGFYHSHERIKTHSIGEVLAYHGDMCRYTYGLWEIDLFLLDTYPRDRGTPVALCIGGEGTLNHEDFNLSLINSHLTGRETTEAILASTHHTIRNIIERSGMFDYVPLLQALDLHRTTECDDPTRALLHSLPQENDPAAQDAFWVIVLALSSLGGEEIGNEIIETTMDRLGWEDDDGSFLTAPKIKELCGQSLLALATVGAYGNNAKNPVERLDMYRELLRA